MSLINTMLVDLESRRGGGATAANQVFSDLHSASNTRDERSSRSPVLMSLLLLSLLVYIGTQGLQNERVDYANMPAKILSRLGAFSNETIEPYSQLRPDTHMVTASSELDKGYPGNDDALVIHPVDAIAINVEVPEHSEPESEADIDLAIGAIANGVSSKIESIPPSASVPIEQMTIPDNTADIVILNTLQSGGHHVLDQLDQIEWKKTPAEATKPSVADTNELLAGRKSINGMASEKARAPDTGHDVPVAVIVPKGKNKPEDTPLVVQQDVGNFSKIPSQAKPLVSTDQQLRQANQLIKQGRLEAAIRILEELQQSMQGNDEVALLLSYAYQRSGRDADAEIILAIASAKSDADAKVLMMYARLLADKGQLHQARQVLASNPPAIADNAEYHAQIAALAQRDDDHRTASGTYRHLLETHTQQGVWWLGLGISLAALSDQRAAHDAFTNSLQDPQMPKRLQQFVNHRLGLSQR